MGKDIIDVHVHFGSPRNKENDCFWSTQFTQSPAYIVFLLSTKSLFKKVNYKRIKKHILKTINKSKYVDKCVLLAFDRVYDKNGNVLENDDQTHLYVPNDYIIDLAKSNKRILFGASINPFRKDWNEELTKCLANKAVLCKWIPSSQQIDPTHEKCEAFYKKLAEYNLPLLCHCGPEYSIPTSNERYIEYNNPKYLRRALELGVTVIIAHCALPYFWFMDTDYTDDFKEFKKLFKEALKNDWNLYADVSALATLLRRPYFEEIEKLVPSDRLLFGSDFPHPVFEASYKAKIKFFSWLKLFLKVIMTKNLLDKNYLVFKKKDFGDSIFTNAAELFAKINY